MGELQYENLRINSERLWDSLMSMAKIGETPLGGCNRQALTEDDKTGRELFIKWCEDINCRISIDKMGNIFARRQGSDNNLPPVITGSHLDTQPTGGKFDGVYGVLGGLEVLRTLEEHSITTKHPIEVVVWTNEEGARFSPAMIGSGVWSGVFDLDYGHSRSDKAGITIKQALEKINFLGIDDCKYRDIKAAFELHIEQGPILEDKGIDIGIVEGVQEIRWYDLIIKGVPCHAGPTPMNLRKDPFMGLCNIQREIYKMIEQYGELSRVTFGDLKVTPGARNTVPEEITLAIDLRHPEQSTLNMIDKDFREIVAKVSNQFELESSIVEEWDSPAVQFAPSCIEAVSKATQALNYNSLNMFSGAGHDSVYVSRVAPTSMIFIPCEDGISHNEAEMITEKHASMGCNVLLHALIETAC